MGNISQKINKVYKNIYNNLYRLPSPPRLHRSINGLPESICITLECNNKHPENRECQYCNTCTKKYGCTCRIYKMPY
jgi:hypothetical protein